MATRTSNMISQKEYLGSKRGRPIANNIGWEMFPGKLEQTDIIEDSPFDQLNNDRRDTLKDYSPEQTSLFPYEETRRNTYARDRLNLREGGARVTTDPWANSGQNGGDGFDISFHDKDPRGWSTEQPWKEYRRLLENVFQNTDFKDDGDYSETSGSIHPNTLYKKIRSSQNWLKSRLKIFSEEWEGRSNGGVGVYDNTSKVYRSAMEDSSAQTDGVAPSRTFDDPEVAQHHNVNISNVVHLGSKFMRENSTTDHLVKVASYGKLYKQRGLINHESQLRIMEDDTPWSKIEGSNQTPRNLVKLMASQIYSDNSNVSPYTAQEISRILMQADKLEDGAHQGVSREELQNYNRNRVLTMDVVALLGVTANDIKYLESMQGKNKKMAQKALANIYNLVTVVHATPANVKLQMRNELILRSAGMGLKPASGSDLRKLQDTVVVNPKIVEYMANKTKSNMKITDTDIAQNRDSAFADPENKLNNKLSNTALFVYKTPNKSTEDLTNALWSTTQSAVTKDTSKQTASYKHLAKFSNIIEKNARNANPTQIANNSRKTYEYKTMLISDNDYQENLRNTALDNNFGENKALSRRIAPMGTKQMRKYVDSDYLPVDNMNEIGNSDDSGRVRKNAKNRNNMSL